MNLQNIIQDFAQEVKWLEGEMDIAYNNYERSDFTDEGAINHYTKMNAIHQRITFIKSEMESVLEIYRK